MKLLCINLALTKQRLTRIFLLVRGNEVHKSLAFCISARNVAISPKKGGVGGGGGGGEVSSLITL